MRTKLGKRYYILYHTNQAYKATRHHYLLQFAKTPIQYTHAKNRTQEPSFTLNATQGSEKINQMPSSFTSLISLDI